MKPRYSFSSRHSKRATESSKMRKQRAKYPELLKKVIDSSDIILEILDARFIKETRNKEIEKEIKNKNKQIIYVINKSDLVEKKASDKFKILQPNVFISCTKRAGIKSLRDKIKMISKKIKSPVEENKITIGVIGYPNTGKSSIINILVGKKVAGTGAEAGFTKGLQKLKLSPEIILLDSPGVIPKEKYSMQDEKIIAENTKLGGRSYSQVKDPEMILAELMKTHGEQIEKFYKINSKGNTETLIEILGKKKGYLKKGNQIDEDKTSRLILKDWQDGKIKV